MRSLFTASLLAVLAALLITFLYKPRPLDVQLLHLQLEQTIPEYANALGNEPAELQALFLLYADDPVLTAKARLALLRYPDLARPILVMFGDSQDFQTILRKYGEDVVLPIHYFLIHEVFTLELMRGMSESARSALDAVRRLWSSGEPAQAGANSTLSSEDRGWYAVQFIKAEGYDFLGQFVISPKGEVGWIQTERVLEGINGFFANGLKGLETKLRRDETIVAGDVGWAALDVAIGVGALKVLRMGKAGASGGRSLTFSQRSAALGSGLWRTSAIGTRVLKYGAPAVLAYIAIRHPSVINSMFGSVAENLGLPVGLVQVVGWTLVLLPLMLLLRFALGPLAWAMAAIAGLLRWGQGVLRGRPAAY
jgi:hypothetical protein